MTSEELYKLIDDRLEGWELVELLEISAEDICLAFEDEVFDKMKAIKDLLELDDDEDEENESTDYDETD